MVTNVTSRTSSKSVDELKEEVHKLTLHTDQLRDESTLAMAVTTTAGLATAAGGALSLLSATHNLGLSVAGIAGLCLAGGVALSLHTNSKLAKSEVQRLAVASELFDSRRAVSREKLRQLFGSVS